jgi:hypothetical protein
MRFVNLILFLSEAVEGFCPQRGRNVKTESLC